ncbi:hypothetical protein M9434_004487 [Picochlorum sp. BPE23]|nr:hypothetical protein M9434_004487 [Picochlorum sp. BPE23]
MDRLKKYLRSRKGSTIPQTREESGDAFWNFDEYYMPNPNMGEPRYETKLRRSRRATLVDVGQDLDIGESRVQYRGANIPLHLITKDFFISMVQLHIMWLVVMTMAMFIVIFFFWSGWWWLVMLKNPSCFSGPDQSYVDALLFSVITQMTIGYGNTAPDSCWVATWLVIIQSVVGIVLDAIVLGIIFAKISHPHQRSRSIFISNKAVISRRDGILKFMFRIADVRNAQVVEPKVRAYLYTWGEGRITAESERIPVRVEPIELDYIDGMLLLPLIIEHTIDERSPLCGHTHGSLVQMNSEIVVTFEGTTEMGNPFMTRRSYIPEEIFWGYQFKNVVKVPSGAEPYVVDLNSFHGIEPHKGLPEMPKDELSQFVVNRAKRTVPYPLLGDNTLVLSDVLCVCPNERGNLCVYCRVGDTYPNQMLEITAKMYLYRWKKVTDVPGSGTAPAGESFEQIMLACGYRNGSDRIHLRLPILVTHEIDEKSPLRSWAEPGGLAADSNAEIVVVINAYIITSGLNILRQRTYRVQGHVRYGYGFMPMVKHPGKSLDRKPRIRWQHFHDVIKSQGMDNFPPPPLSEQERQGSTGPGRDMFVGKSSKSFHTAPSVEHDIPNLDRYRKDLSTSITESKDKRNIRWKALEKYSKDMSDTGNSLPHAAALHPALPGKDRFREVDDIDRNEFTVQANDLHRYSAAIGTDTLPKTSSLTFTPLPSDFWEKTAEAQIDNSSVEVPESPGVPISNEERSNEIITEQKSDVEESEQNITTIEEEADTKEYRNSEGEDAGPIYFGNRESPQENRSLAIFANLLKEGQLPSTKSNDEGASSSGRTSPFDT